MEGILWVKPLTWDCVVVASKSCIWLLYVAAATLRGECYVGSYVQKTNVVKNVDYLSPNGRPRPLIFSGIFFHACYRKEEMHTVVALSSSICFG